MAEKKEVKEVPVQTEVNEDKIKNLCEEGTYGNVED